MTKLGEIEWNQDRPPKWLPRAILMVAAAVALFMVGQVLLHELGGFLIILFTSLFLSFAIEPAVDALEEKGWRRGSATGLVFLVIGAVMAVMTWLMATLVIRQVSSLIDDAPQLIGEATDWINGQFDTQITTDNIVEQVQTYQDDIASAAGDVGNRVLAITNSALGVVFQLFTIALFTFYFVADGPKLRRTICSVLPPERQRMVLSLWELAIAKTGSYLYSRLLLATASAFASAIVLTIIGVPSPVPLAIWLGVVSQFVPVVGTYIGGALPIVIALIDHPINAVWVIIFILIYQQFENYFLSPRVTARTMAIHPAVAFGSAIVGASVIGPVGALLALPAAAIIQAFVSSFLQRHDVIDSTLIDPKMERPEDDAKSASDASDVTAAATESVEGEPSS